VVFFALAFMAMIMWVGGLGSKVLFPNVKPDQGTVLMMSKLLSPFGAAFGMVGILAAIMSTAAGLFLIVAVSIAVDIYHDTIFPRMKNPPPKEVLERRELWMQRVLIALPGFVGFLLARKPPPFWTALVWMGIGLFTGSVISPMIVGCLWKGTTKRAAEIAAISGFILYIILLIGFGAWKGVPLFKVPWAPAGICTIVSTVLVIFLSLVTQPMDKAYLDRVLAKI
jgi:Na+/proline symporter